MNNNNFFRKHFLNILFLVVPFILIGIFWNQIPETIPTHWNIKGEADAFGSKWSIFILPVVNIAVFLLFLVIPKIDPKKKFEQFEKTYSILVNVMVALMFGIFCIIFLTVLGMIDNSTNWVLYLMTILFMVIGNYMGKVRPNYFIGIRTPWTLEHEEVWTKTHRFGGKLWVLGSFLMLMLGFFIGGEMFANTFIVYVMVIAIVPLVYSYLAYRQLEEVAA